MTELGIDIETYSSEDLASCGVYRYAEAPDFAVLLFAYSVDGGTVRCVDIACGEELPPEVLSALTDPAVTPSSRGQASPAGSAGGWSRSSGSARWWRLPAWAFHYPSHSVPRCCTLSRGR